MAEWKKIHDLQAYLAYRKHKEGEDKKRVCEDLAEDPDFKDYISYGSIAMKIENYKYYYDRKGKLDHYSRKSIKVVDKYKYKSISEIQTAIQKMKKVA